MHSMEDETSAQAPYVCNEHQKNKPHQNDGVRWSQALASGIQLSFNMAPSDRDLSESEGARPRAYCTVTATVAVCALPEPPDGVAVTVMV
jgi:hypothetical protein